MRVIHLAVVMLIVSSQTIAQQGKAKSPVPARRPGASLAETVAFLQSKLPSRYSVEASFEYPCPPNTGSWRCVGNQRKSDIFLYTDVAVEKCSITMTWKREHRYEIPDDPYYERETWEASVVLPLSQIAFTSIKVSDLIDGDKLASGARLLKNGYLITLPLSSPLELHLKHAASSDTDADKEYVPLKDKDPIVEKDTQWAIALPERDVAERVSKAFQRAAELCGAKPEPF